MLKTLWDLYNYTNDKLLQGELDSIDDVIDYFEECQQIIANQFPIEAPKIVVNLTSNEITKPSDFHSLRKIVINNTEVKPVDIWADIIELPKDYTSGEATLYYYKKPTELDKNNLNQVLDIDPRYLTLIGKYAAEMYYLADDDPEMRDAYKTAFIEQFMSFGNLNKDRKRSNYSNIW